MKIKTESLSLKPKAKAKPVQPADVEAKEELSEVLQGFKARKEAESKRRLEATDSEFWCALCFETRAQKEEFLSKLGLLAHGDKYLDGRLVAEKLGIVLENKGTLAPLKVRRDKDFEALSLKRREVM